MAKYVFDPRKDPPAAGPRQVYIKPGRYKMRIVKYSDNPSNAGKDMHQFTFEIMSGEEKGKKITDYFVMPKTKRDSRFPIQRLNALIVAAVQPSLTKSATVDLAKLKNRDLIAMVGDVREEARKDADGKEYPARTISRIQDYIDPRAEADEDEDEEDEEEEDEEDEEPAPKRKAKVKAAAKPKAKAAAASSRRARRDEEEEEEEDEDEDDEDDDFDFDDDDDDE